MTLLCGELRTELEIQDLSNRPEFPISAGGNALKLHNTDYYRTSTEHKNQDLTHIHIKRKLVVANATNNALPKMMNK